MAWPWKQVPPSDEPEDWRIVAEWLMRIDAKLDLVLEEMGLDMARTRIDPELRAQWAEGTRRMLAWIDRLDARIAAQHAARERREARLRRWTLGIFPRH
jgi:hypothetical protein